MLREFSPALRVYLLLISIAGPLVALSATNLGVDSAHQRWLALLLLSAAAVVAARYPLRLTYQMRVDVSSAAYMAMILVLPSGLPGLLAFCASVVSQLRRQRNHVEVSFNAGQVSLYVAAAAGVFAATRAGVGDSAGATLLAAGVAAGAMHLVNTALVSIAAGLQLGTSPLRVWRANATEDLPAHAALTLLGGVAAVVAIAEPLLLPALALPAVLVHVAVRNYIQLRADTTEALASLIDIVELRDPYTAGHSRRVAQTARALALLLGLTTEEADEIESAGRVHDLGKVAIDPAILSKPGKLSESEWLEMCQHPALGATVLAKFNAFQHGHPLVRHHHERWDGAGYPDKLAGDAIPRGARILAVADTFDALTSDRPYRSGMSVEQALRILRQGAGEQWDADIVEALNTHCRGATTTQESGVVALAPAGA